MSGNNTATPSRLARGLSAVLGLGLTVFTWIAAVGLVVLIAFGTEWVYGLVGSNGQVIAGQRESIRQNVEKLSAKYGFSPGNIMDRISDEDLKSMNMATAKRLSGAVWTGTLAEPAKYSTDAIEEALWEDEDFLKNSRYPVTDTLVRLLGEEIGSTVEEKTKPFREILLTAGVRLGNRVIRLPALAAMIKQIPVISGLCALLMCGLIALLVGGRRGYWLWYTGAAMTAGGALLILTPLLLPMLGLSPMLATVSELLAWEYKLFTIIASGLGLVLAAALIVSGLVMMNQARRRMRG